MREHRQLSPSEARIGLALIACLLAAFGYALVDRLGGPTHPVDNAAVPTGASAGREGPAMEAPAVESMRGATYQASYPPQWLRPLDEVGTAVERDFLPDGPGPGNAQRAIPVR